MRHGRLTTAMLAALAVMAIAPAWAAAAPSSFLDDSAADFAAGTLGGGASLDVPGSVQLSPVEQFDGAGLPAGMTAAPPSAATVSGGTLKVNAGRVTANRFSEPGQVLQVNATFVAGEVLQHLGFGDTLDDNQPWAIFSTGGDGTGLFARARTAAGPEATPIRIAAFDAPAVLGAPHVYRIEWSATDVKYFVDGALVATQDVAITTPMRPIVSDFTDNLAAVTVDSLGLLTGNLQSRVLDARDEHAAWGTVTATTVKPAGTDVGIETRSGNTATPDGTWSAWQALSGSAIQSPSARYLQYRAKLSTTDAAATPSLDSVQIAFDDSTGPSVTVGDPQVSGSSATVTFSSAAADLDHLECSLDGGAFAACTSPKAFSGLAAGSHTVSVHGIDALGNVGPATAKAFTIAGSQATGGTGGGSQTGGGATTTTQQSSGGSSTVAAVDKTKPKATLVAKSLKVSKKGTVSFTVGCPATETSCKIKLQLKNGTKGVASKVVTVKGGKTKTVTLTLNAATRKLLKKHSSLKLSTVLTATDAAGNKRTTTKATTLRRAGA